MCWRKKPTRALSFEVLSLHGMVAVDIDIVTTSLSSIPCSCVHLVAGVSHAIRTQIKKSLSGIHIFDIQDNNLVGYWVVNCETIIQRITDQKCGMGYISLST